MYLDVTLLTARAAMSRLSVTFTRGHAYLSVKGIDSANFAFFSRGGLLNWRQKTLKELSLDLGGA